MGIPDSLEGNQERGAPPRPRSQSGIFALQPSPKAGVRLGERYVIEGLYASGSSSDVYLATDERSGGEVMVKWLTPQAARDQQLRERFVLSAQVTMAVEHPAVLRVYGVEEPKDVPPYLVMEALLGESLSDYLERESSMPETLVLPMAREVAAGLAAAHRVGIIHRDIKPGNLFLVGPLGAPVATKIIDFGLAKDTRDDGDDDDIGPSSTNLILGTAQYMAPEQVLADPIDGRTDIYGFGAVLFRALTGQLPFDLDPGADLFSHQLFSPTPPPSWLLENVDPRLEQLVLRAMRKHPENRYPTMDALIAELSEIAESYGRPPADYAAPPLAREPDVYKPRNPKGRDAAEALAVYFGTSPPPPPTSRLGSDAPEAAKLPERD